MKELYKEHLAERQRLAEQALEATGFEALVLSSGTPFRYFADDMDAPHHSSPHFAHWVPLAGPYHLLLIRPGEKPRLIRYAPEDYWYEQAPIDQGGDPFWLDSFDYEEAGDRGEAWKRVAGNGRTAYVGDAPDEAAEHGIEDAQPEELLARLDWGRSYKSAYEAECVEEASRMAARGHVAARAAFEGGASELAIHHAYVTGVGCVDHQLPYPSIVALDEKGATLHYEKKRTLRDGKVLLIDAGATCNGYASDITRTWTASTCDATFAELVSGMDELQRGLCAAVRPGLTYPELHHLGHVRIGDLLNAVGVLKLGGEDAVEAGLTRAFFPHGLGHFLGIQVHDVAGHQAGPSGGTNPPDEKHPYLRTTRRIEERMLFTVEPGVYFIPMLLRDVRSGERSDAVDWDLVDRLTPLGGVRIEDNLYVTANGSRNLTRDHI
jgi:Xaa-Pro dipeptidase